MNTPRQWSTSLRVERRYGVTRYVAQFSDGLLRASLFGSLAGDLSEVKQAGLMAAVDWMAHVHPIPRRPFRPVRRVHFPRNKSRKSHRKGKRA